MRHQEPELHWVLKLGVWSQLEDHGFWPGSSPSTWVEVTSWVAQFQFHHSFITLSSPSTLHFFLLSFKPLLNFGTLLKSRPDSWKHYSTTTPRTSSEESGWETSRMTVANILINNEKYKWYRLLWGRKAYWGYVSVVLCCYMLWFSAWIWPNCESSLYGLPLISMHFSVSRLWVQQK